MNKETKNECQCSQAACGCPAAPDVPCSCGESCNCSRVVPASQEEAEFTQRSGPRDRETTSGRGPATTDLRASHVKHRALRPGVEAQ
jgi:hypothetical protein